MLKIDPSNITEQDNYNLLIGTIVPRPIAFITTLSEDGVLNAAPFSYFNIVAANPPLISVSIQRSNGRQKDTARNILAKKEFVVHVVDQENVEQVNQTSANLPPDESEVELTNLTSVASTEILVPGVKEAKVRLECRLEHALELGGNKDASCDFLIGRVVQFHINEEIYQNGMIDTKSLGAVSRLAGNDYAKIGETFSLKRPGGNK